MYSKVFYYWHSPHRVTAIAFAMRLLWGKSHTLFCHSWSFGPFTIAITDLDRK